MLFRINNDFYAGGIVLNDNDPMQMTNGNVFPSDNNYTPAEDDKEETWTVSII